MTKQEPLDTYIRMKTSKIHHSNLQAQSEQHENFQVETRSGTQTIWQVSVVVVLSMTVIFCFPCINSYMLIYHAVFVIIIMY